MQPFNTEARSVSVQQARSLYFGRGELPESLLDQQVLRSWERCRQAGLDPTGRHGGDPDLRAMRDARERNRSLLFHAQPVLEHLFEQIRDSHSMVVLADERGMVLQSYGDADFLSRAEQVALSPGASWNEADRGTNAVGTALAERNPANVFASEHFFESNAFLTCSAAPIEDAEGRLIGVVDISSDYRAYQRHSLGLVKMSSRIIEKRLFEAEFGHCALLGFHPRPDHVGTLFEGLLALGPDGEVLGADQIALDLLGLVRADLPRCHYSRLFDEPLGSLLDRARREAAPLALSGGRQRFFARVAGRLKTVDGGAALLLDSHGRKLARAPQPTAPAEAPRPTLASLASGDARLQAALDKASRVLGRDIPLLIQGESGVGKELFAQAFHHSGARADGPFIAVNCAAIPETLIEAELFGYVGGAFTGARKEGAIGKIQQAHGGTLFLDEIGDMPLALQARLLRVVQERRVTPLGAAKEVAVDLALVCATHRKLKEEVARGSFREDLYYRLNGLCLNLPPLRERSDLGHLIEQRLRSEAAAERRQRPVQVAPPVLAALLRYRWPGNLRQLANVLKVALALLDAHETTIEFHHLPDDLLEELDTRPATAAPIATPPAAQPAERLDQWEHHAIRHALAAENGNLSATARRLGIGRNTLYRKLGRL